jgi:hypothetical protein
MKMAKDRGVVLIIDDEDGQATKRFLGNSIKSIVRHPNEVAPADLKRAKLVLVDFKLDNWPERDRQETPSLKPKDGIALRGAQVKPVPPKSQSCGVRVELRSAYRS